MDYANLIEDVISSGAIIAATAQIIKGLRTQLASVQRVVEDQGKYIDEMRIDFKKLDSIKSGFIQDLSSLHDVYKDEAQKAYKGLIEIKDSQITALKQKGGGRFADKAHDARDLSAVTFAKVAHKSPP